VRDNQVFPTHTNYGLSKRELFSAMAMQGLCADFKNLYDGDPCEQTKAEALNVLAGFAMTAIALADALIKELEKQQCP
jgi:hypothetical protein